MRACAYCRHARLDRRPPDDGRLMYCELKRQRVRRDYACVAFEREPGSDDAPLAGEAEA